MKKYLIFILSFLLISQTNADFTNLNVSKENAEKIDSYFEKYNSKENLEKVIEKIENSAKTEKIKTKSNAAFVTYMYLKAKESLLQKNYEKKLVEFQNKNISTNEKEILKIQKNILNEIVYLKENSFSLFEEKGSKKVTGDFLNEFYFKNGDEEFSGNLDFLNFEEYDSLLDFSLFSKIFLNLENKENKLKLNSNLDFIFKSGEYFALLKNLEILENSLFGEEILNELKNNNFVRINKNLEKINKNFEIFEKELQNPLFEVYKKENEKYFLVPKKEVCSLLKNTKSCSEKDREKFLENFLKTSELILVIGKENFEIFYKNSGKYNDVNLYFISKNDEISDVKLNIKFANGNLDLFDCFELNYKKNNFLNAYLKSKISDIEALINLNKENKIKEIDFSGNSPFTNGFFTFKEGKFNGDLSWKYRDINTFSLKISENKFMYNKKLFGTTVADLDLNFKDEILNSGKIILNANLSQTEITGKNGKFSGKTDLRNKYKINYDFDFGRENSLFKIVLNEGEKELFRLNSKLTSKTEKINFKEIKKPESFVEFLEAFPEIYYKLGF